MGGIYTVPFFLFLFSLSALSRRYDYWPCRVESDMATSDVRYGF